MARKRLRPDVEAAVLARARRRCAVCYGLSRDAGLKTGQIAHLDRDSSNDDPENLIFICLEAFREGVGADPRQPGIMWLSDHAIAVCDSPVGLAFDRQEFNPIIDQVKAVKLP